MQSDEKPFITKIWRPVLALTVCAVIVNDLIFAPYFRALGLPVSTETPGEFWTFATAVLTIYAGGRSVEKVMKGKAE